MNTATEANRRRGRLQLILLALVFFGPLAVAIALYFTGGTRDGEGVNYGGLLEPPVSVEPKLHFDSGLRERWALIVKPSGDCDDACERALIDVRQVRLATGREIDRIERALLLSSGAALREETVDAHPGLIVLKAGSDARLATAIASALDALPADQIYIMDPIGNVILSYPMAPERKRLLGDLKKLLKLSRIG
ncbi:MAG: hypothetical protein AAFY46_03715 [Planctomycetota bacterium]